MEDIIDNLAELVMNENEAKVYCTLLQNNNSTAKRLYRLSGVDKIETVEILNSLTIKGFCSINYLESEIVYSVIDPDIAFTEVIEKQRRKLCRKESTVLNLSMIFEERSLDA